MKNKSFGLLVAVLVLISLSIQAQKKTYLGAEFALCGDVFNYDNPFHIKDDGTFTGSLGIILGQEINDNFLLETGFIRKDYNILQVWQVPFRIKGKINLSKEKLFLTATVGYSISINTDIGEVSNWGGGQIDSYDTLLWQFSANNSLAKSFSLIESGIGLEYVVFKNFSLYVSSSYYAGWKKIIEINIHTERNSVSTDESFSTSNGSYWNIAFGMKYAISNFWKK